MWLKARARFHRWEWITIQSSEYHFYFNSLRSFNSLKCRRIKRGEKCVCSRIKGILIHVDTNLDENYAAILLA
jgi:hypothetical protein